jgi:hypothetical protein
MLEQASQKTLVLENFSKLACSEGWSMQSDHCLRNVLP